MPISLSLDLTKLQTVIVYKITLHWKVWISQKHKQKLAKENPWFVV